MKKKLAEWLHKRAHKLDDQSVQPVQASKQPYASLTPMLEVNDNDGAQYFDALKWALESDDIKNIAVTGPYGSGKSSVLLTFQKKNTQYNFLNISLATFGKKVDGINTARKNAVVTEPNGNDDNKDEKKSGEEVSEIDSQMIEQSILQQIFYKKTAKDIPDAGFSRKTAFKPRHLICYTACISLWTLSICRLFNIGFNQQPEFINELLNNFSRELNFLSYVIVLAGLSKIIYESIRIIRNLSFQKLKFSASNFEIEADKNKSPLNANFDELLYFFEVTKYRGLIIEDLDRFQSTEIFSKLRELNLLLNSSEQIKEKPIVFIYGIKDDLFVVGDRTKFFDFIIPIIPVVSSSNAGDRLYQMFVDARLSDNLPQAHVHRIGSFVNDMRMLKNIFNEYIFYKNKIGIRAEDKLLGIIAYKNIYPKDFSDLHSGAGIIYNTFKNKADNIAKISEDLKNEIDQQKAKVKELEREIAQNKQELNSLYILKLIERLPSIVNFYLQGQQVKLFQLTAVDFFESLRKESNIRYYDTHSRVRDSGISFQQIEDEVDKLNPYERRFEIVREKENINLPNLKSELSRKEAQYLELKALSLRELLLSYNIEIFNKELSEHELLSYLLKNGAIDEQFQIYISNFYEGVLKKNDQEFLVAVKNGQSLNADFSLSNCSEITKRLQVDDFRDPSVLNKHLVKYLLESQNEHRIYLEPILNQLINGQENAWKFLEFLKEDKTADEFVKFICSSWPEFWQRALGYYKDKPDDILELFIIIADSCSVEVIASLNRKATISDYIVLHYFNIGQKTSDKGKLSVNSIIKQFDLKISKLTETPILSDLNFLIQNKYYAFTKENIAFILDIGIEGVHKKRKDYSFTFTEVIQSGSAELIDYFFQDINGSIDIVLTINQGEEEEADKIQELLNRTDVSGELTLRIVEGLSFVLPELPISYENEPSTEVDEDLCNSLLKYKRILPSWTNVNKYFKQFGITESLLEFLNTPEMYIKLKEGITEALEQSTSKDDLIHNLYGLDLSEEAFNEWRANLPAPALNIVPIISTVRLKGLIDADKIPYNQEYLDALRSIGQDIANYFLKKNLSKIDSDEHSFTYDPLDIVYILTQPELSKEQGAKVVQILDKNLFNAHHELPVAVSQLILNERLHKIDASLIKSLFQSGMPVAEKLSLFKKLNSTKGVELDLSLLQMLGEPYLHLFVGANNFKQEDIDIDILQILKQNKFIHDFEVGQDGVKIIRSDE